MKFKFSIRREIKILAAVLIVAGIIAFSERKQNSAAINDITIKITNVNENHFLDERDIIDLINLDKEDLKGSKPKPCQLKRS